MRNMLTSMMLLGALVYGAARAGDSQDATPRLSICDESAVLEEAGRETRTFRSLAEVARALAGRRGEFEVRAVLAGVDAGKRTVEGRPGRKEKPIRIAPGEIPALEFVRFLADYTGLPVIYDSTDRALAERTIHIPAPIKAADRHLVKRMLEANRFRVTESASGPEGRVILIESADAPAGPDEPRPRPIVVVGEEHERRRVEGSRPAARTAKGPESGAARHAGIILEDVPEVVRAQVDLEEGRGVLVSDVDEAVAKASRDLSALKRYDIITHVNDTVVTSPAKLAAAINALLPGEVFHLRVLRKGILTILRGRKN